MSEMNAPPQPDDFSEMSLREKIRTRLLTDHNDMAEQVLQRWLDLLEYDGMIDKNTTRVEAARGKLLGPTALLTMMDVRDGPVRAREARLRFGLAEET